MNKNENGEFAFDITYFDITIQSPLLSAQVIIAKDIALAIKKFKMSKLYTKNTIINSITLLRNYHHD